MDKPREHSSHDRLKSADAESTGDMAPQQISRPVLERGAALGRYLVTSVLGQGGMGVVYAAYDPELDRKLAIKLVQAEEIAGSDGQKWLLREAQALAKLSHPNVIAIHDVGSLPDGRVFIAMELVEGQTVRAWLRVARPSWRQIVSVYRAAGEGLAAAHAAGLVHRDFKPDNVLIGKDGRVRVLDFGLARSAEGDDAKLPPSSSSTSSSPDLPRSSTLDSKLTQAGRIIGTPAYMAPEQWAHRPADAHSDQFSFAVSLFEALYGKRPFEISARSNPDWDWKPTEPTGRRIPRRLRKLLFKALSRKPEARFNSMQALLEELQRDPYRREKRLGAALAACLLLATGLGVVRQLDRRQQRLCQGSEAKLAGIWDTERHRQVEEAFLATRLPSARDALERTVNALDSYARKWARARTDACEATRVRGEQSDEMLGLRMECLDRRLSELGALTEILAQADAKVVPKAVQAAVSLTGVEDCADVAALRSSIRPPPANQRAKVAELRHQLDRVKALFDSGKGTEAAAQLQGTLAAVSALGYGPLEAEAYYVAGRTVSESAEMSSRESRAFRVALASGDDPRAALAAVQNMRNFTNLHQLPEAELWSELAQALVDRLGQPESLLAQLWGREGTLLAREGRPEEAVKLCRKDVALVLKRSGPGTVDAAEAYNSLATTLVFAGRADESVEFFQNSVDIGQRIFGPQYPRNGIGDMNLSSAYTQMGDAKKAIDYAERAQRIFSEAFSVTSSAYLTATLNLGEAYLLAGELEQARRTLQGVLAVRQKAEPDSDPVAEVFYDLCELDLAERRPAAAVRDGQRSLEIRSKLLDSDSPFRAASAGCLGTAEALNGQRDAARLHLTEALRVLTPRSPFPTEVAQDEFALAKLTVHTEAGDALARSAEEVFRHYHREAQAADARSWLERHR